MKTGSNLFAPDKNTPPKGPTSWAKLSYFQKFAIITMVFALPVLAFIPLAYEQYQRIDQYGTKEAQGVLSERSQRLRKYRTPCASFVPYWSMR